MSHPDGAEMSQQVFIGGKVINKARVSEIGGSSLQKFENGYNQRCEVLRQPTGEKT